MADIEFPSGLSPFKMTHYLQPHVGGAESPFTRTRKVYSLSKPRWMASLSFKGVQAEFGRGSRTPPILDSLIIRLAGGANRIALWDFRRPYPIGLRDYYGQFSGQLFSFTLGETFDLGEQFYVGSYSEPSNEYAAAGATEIYFSGFQSGETVFRIGDYFGGDGRMHMIHNDAVSDGDGRALVTFDPPLESALGAGDATTYRPTAMFRLTDEDAGAAEEVVGQEVVYTLNFIEDLP